MRQLPSTDPTQVRFGSPQRVRRIGRLVCLAATAALLALALAGDGRSGWWIASMSAALVLTLAGALAMLPAASLLVDIPNRSYTRRDGALGLFRTSVGDAAEFTRIGTSWGPGGCAIAIVGRRGTWKLDRFDDPSKAIEAARQLGEMLGVPVETTRPASEAQRRAPSRAVRLAAWGACACACALLIAPMVYAVVPVWLASRQHAPESNARSRSLLQDGMQRYWLRDYRRSADALNAALQADRHNAEAANMLAYAYADQKRMDEALRSARLALHLAPDSGNILDTVAEMHERRREYRPAAFYYRQALDHMDAYAATQTHAKFGRTLLALGRRSEAHAHLKAAVAFGIYDQWTRMANSLLRRIDPKAAQHPQARVPLREPMARSGMPLPPQIFAGQATPPLGK